MGRGVWPGDLKGEEGNGVVGKERIEAESTKEHLVEEVMKSYCDNGDR